MKAILKAGLFGLGLAAGASGLAQAQSVSSLPPDVANQGQTGQTAHTYPYGSTQSFYPKPGGSEVITEPTYQAPAVPQQSQAYPPYQGPRTN